MDDLVQGLFGLLEAAEGHLEIVRGNLLLLLKAKQIRMINDVSWIVTEVFLRFWSTVPAR